MEQKLTVEDLVGGVQWVREQNPDVRLTPLFYYRYRPAWEEAKTPVCEVCLLGSVYARITGMLTRDALEEYQSLSGFELNGVLSISCAENYGVSDAYLLATGRRPRRPLLHRTLTPEDRSLYLAAGATALEALERLGMIEVDETPAQLLEQLEEVWGTVFRKEEGS